MQEQDNRSQGKQQDESLIGRDERTQQQGQNQQSGQHQQGGDMNRQRELAEGGDKENQGAAEGGQGDYGSAGEANGGLSEASDDETEHAEMRDRDDESMGGSSDSDR